LAREHNGKRTVILISFGCFCSEALAVKNNDAAAQVDNARASPF
jgi:hypothetical protein